MADFDVVTRARLAYDRSKWLTTLSAGALILLTVFLNTIATYQVNAFSMRVALLGFAFTLFVSTGLQIAASAADRWSTTRPISPALLVWEWRMLVLAHLSLLASCLALVDYILNNIPPLA
jgi:hypothetical protein